MPDVASLLRFDAGFFGHSMLVRVASPIVVVDASSL